MNGQKGHIFDSRMFSLFYFLIREDYTPYYEEKDLGGPVTDGVIPSGIDGK